MSKANEFFEKGCRAIKWHRHRQAERYFTAALSIDPDWHDALQRRAFARVDLGKLREAVSDYRHALRVDPRCDWCLEPLADVYAKLGKDDEAVTCLSQAIRLKPRIPSYKYDRGQAYLRLGRYRAAILDFERIRKSKRFGLLWREGRGQALALLGMTLRALRDLDICVRLRPDTGETWYYRGLVKLLAHDEKGASKDLRQARKHGHRVPPLASLKGRELSRLLRTRD